LHLISIIVEQHQRQQKEVQESISVDLFLSFPFFLLFLAVVLPMVLVLSLSAKAALQRLTEGELSLFSPTKLAAANLGLSNQFLLTRSPHSFRPSRCTVCKGSQLEIWAPPYSFKLRLA
jgi:hypothetical protein